MKTLNIAEARRDFCSLAADIFESGDSVIISRHGTPCLLLSKYSPERIADERTAKPAPPSIRQSPLFGMWADREDMKDPRAWIESMRAKRRERWS